METFVFSPRVATCLDQKGNVLETDVEFEEIWSIHLRCTESGYSCILNRQEIQEAQQTFALPWLLRLWAPSNSPVGLLYRLESKELKVHLGYGSFTGSSSGRSGFVSYFLEKSMTTSTNDAVVSAVLKNIRGPPHTIVIVISGRPSPAAKALLPFMTKAPEPLESLERRDTLIGGKDFDIQLKPTRDDSAANQASTEVKAHKSVLESLEYFRDMFASEMSEAEALKNPPTALSRTSPGGSELDKPGQRESELPVIRLSLQINTLKALISFLYTGTINLYSNSVLDSGYPGFEASSVDFCEARDAWIAGERYGIPRLQTVAARYIIEHSSEETVLTELVFDPRISLHKGLSEIYNACADLDAKKILKSQVFQNVVAELASGQHPASSSKALSDFVQRNAD